MAKDRSVVYGRSEILQQLCSTETCGSCPCPYLLFLVLSAAQNILPREVPGTRSEGTGRTKGEEVRDVQ